MATDVLELTPLFPDDDEAAIWGRMRGDANGGLDPATAGDAWTDTREGSQWHLGLSSAVREIARLYDLMGTEVVAAGMPVWAWGQWLDDHAEVQTIVRLAAVRAEGLVKFSGPAGTPIPSGTPVGVVPATPDDDPPEFEVIAGGEIPDAGAGSGTIELGVRAVDGGEAGNVAAEAITYATTLPGVNVTNDEPMEGGTNTESDEDLRARVIATYLGQGAGNVRDYVRWASAWAGVGRVTVIPLWNGPGTVKVIVMRADGSPVATSVRDAVQNDLDPTAGKGDGRAPVSATVTVETATALAIAVAALVELVDGYSLDGAGGTLAILDDITDALRSYIESVPSGGEVVFQKVRGLIATIEGVHDVGAVTVNGGTVNVAVDDDPAQAPTLTVPPTITAGTV